MGGDFLHPYRPAPEPIQRPVQRYLVSLPRVRRPRSGVDLPSPSSAEVKEEQNYTCTPVWTFTTCSRVNFTCTSYLCLLVSLFLPSLNGSWNYSAYLVERPFPFLRRLDGQNIKLTRSLHLVTKLPVSGVNTAFYHTSAWRGV